MNRKFAPNKHCIIKPGFLVFRPVIFTRPLFIWKAATLGLDDYSVLNLFFPLIFRSIYRISDIVHLILIFLRYNLRNQAWRRFRILLFLICNLIYKKSHNEMLFFGCRKNLERSDRNKLLGASEASLRVCLYFTLFVCYNVLG